MMHKWILTDALSVSATFCFYLTLPIKRESFEPGFSYTFLFMENGRGSSEYNGENWLATQEGVFTSHVTQRNSQAPSPSAKVYTYTHMCSLDHTRRAASSSILGKWQSYQKIDKKLFYLLCLRSFCLWNS